MLEEHNHALNMFATQIVYIESLLEKITSK